MAFSACIVFHSGDEIRFGMLCRRLAAEPLINEVLVLFNNSEQIVSLEQASKTRCFYSKNKGYGSGINHLVRKSNPKNDLIFVNPDIWISGQSLTKILSGFLDSNLSLVAPRSRSGGQEYSSARNLPKLHFHIVRFLRMPIEIDYELEFSNNSQRYSKCGFVSGAFWVVRRSAHDAVSGFDERYFLYMEDIDYCRRLGTETPDTIALDTEVVIMHSVGNGMRKTIKLFYQFIRSIVIYYGMKTKK